MASNAENSLRTKIEAVKLSINELMSGGDDIALAGAQAELSALFLLDQRISDANSGFRKAAKLLRKNEAWEALFDFHIARGQAFEQISRIPEASKAYRKAISINRQYQGGDQNEIKALLHLGELLLRSRNPIKARRRLNQAEKLAKKIEDELALIDIYSAQSKCHLAMSAYEKALAYGKRSRDLAIQFDRDTSELEATYALGVIRYLSKDFSGAGYEFEKYLKRCKQLAFEESYLGASEYLCQIYFNLGKYRELAEIAAAAIAHAKQNNPDQVAAFESWQVKAAGQLSAA